MCFHLKILKYVTHLLSFSRFLFNVASSFHDCILQIYCEPSEEYLSFLLSFFYFFFFAIFNILTNNGVISVHSINCVVNCPLPLNLNLQTKLILILYSHLSIHKARTLSLSKICKHACEQARATALAETRTHTYSLNCIH